MAQLKSTSITGNLAVTGYTNFGNDIYAEQNATITNDLTVQNNASITGNITASKFIKKDGQAYELLLANGDVLPQLNLTSTATDTTHVADGDILINKPFITSLSINSTTNTLDVTRHSMVELGINIVYSFKGSKTWAELQALTSASVGDVYNISTTDGNNHSDTNAGHDWVCHKAFTSVRTAEQMKEHWTDLGNYVDLSGYLPRKGGDMYGTIHRTFTSNAAPAMLTAKAANYDVKILSVYNNTSSSATSGHTYGYDLCYRGSNGNPQNYLYVLCDNGNGASPKDGWCLDEAGRMGVGCSPYNSYRLTVNGASILGGDMEVYYQGSNGLIFAGAFRSETGNIEAEGDVIIKKSFIGPGRSSSWWDGRDNALLQQTATSASTYRPVMSVKTTNGSWDVGHYRYADWHNILQFNYTSDATYNDNKNSVSGAVNQTFHGLQLSETGNITIGGTTYAFNSAAQFTYNSTDKCIDVIFN